MRKLTVFNHVSLDGFFVDQNGDMGWAHRNDAEWNNFAIRNATKSSVLLLGRVTYDMLSAFWTSPFAKESMRDMAERLDRAPKYVASRTLQAGAWNNTHILGNDLIADVRRMKSEPGDPIVVFGSGTVVSQLSEAGLVDEFHVVVNPVVLGQGRPLFGGITKQLKFERVSTRTFENGNVLVCYEPLAPEREIVSIRTFPISRDRLFRAFGDPTRLARWWGPKGFTNTLHEFDLRPGGHWRFVMRAPNGTAFTNHSTFVDVVPPSRIAFQHLSDPCFRMTMTFDESRGGTTLTWRMRFETTELRDTYKSVCVPGNEQNFDRLAAELAHHA